MMLFKKVLVGVAAVACSSVADASYSLNERIVEDLSQLI